VRPGLILALYDFAMYLFLPVYLLFGFILSCGRMSRFRRYRERLGLGKSLRGLPREALWLHAVSVGEVAATAILIPFLRSAGRAIILSCTSEGGVAMAKKKLGEDFPVFYAPFDAPAIVRRFMRLLRPKALAVAEMEIWPNLFQYAGLYGIPLVIYNARMPDKEWRRYARWKALFARVLLPVRLIAAQSAEDASRYCDIGAAIDRIKLAGNIKCDIEPDANLRGLPFVFEKPVIVLASSHRGEEALVLGALTDLFASRGLSSWGAHLIIAPRNIKRARRIARLAKRRNLSALLRTECHEETGGAGDVIILDTLGELPSAYSMARLVLIGGSFTKRVQGHSPLEAAALARPMIFGPYMGNFREGRDALLAAGAACEVIVEGAAPEPAKQRGAGGSAEDARADGGITLRRALEMWFDNPEEAEAAGERAREALGGMRGAAKRTASLISNFLR